MTSQEAISILGGREEFIEEFITEHIFELKTNLLKGTLIPQVLQKKSEKLQLLSNALIVLGFEDEHHEKVNTGIELNSTKIEDNISFYRAYENIISQLKLELMRSFHPRVVAEILMNIAELEANKFSNLFEFYSHQQFEEHVKISDHVDSGVVLSELKTKSGDDDVFDHISQFPTLQKEIMKSIKYCKFVQSKSSK